MRLFFFASIRDGVAGALYFFMACLLRFPNAACYLMTYVHGKAAPWGQAGCWGTTNPFSTLHVAQTLACHCLGLSVLDSMQLTGT